MNDHTGRRRPSPSMVVAVVALVFAVAGTGVAATLINGNNIRNGTVGGEKLKSAAVFGAKVRNFSLPGTKLQDNSVTGRQVNEASLVGVSPGTLVTRRLNLGETSQLVQHGPLSLTARCRVDGPNEVVEVLAGTSVAGSILQGSDNRDGSPNFLDPATADNDRQLVLLQGNAGEVTVGSDTSEGYVLAPDGTRVVVIGDIGTLGLNYAGTKCLLAVHVLTDKI